MEFGPYGLELTRTYFPPDGAPPIESTRELYRDLACRTTARRVLAFEIRERLSHLHVYRSDRIGYQLRETHPHSRRLVYLAFRITRDGRPVFTFSGILRRLLTTNP